MGTTPNYSWTQTAHYNNTVYLVTFLLVLTLSTLSSRAASIGAVSCVCTTQVPVDTTPVISVKDRSTGVSTVLLQPTPVQEQKLTFTLRKKIKMADQQVKGDVGVAKEVASKEVNKEVATGKYRQDCQDASKENPQDNIVFPKDDETTSEVPKRTMPVVNRILIGGPPNDGYGRDANGDIVEIFQ